MTQNFNLLYHDVYCTACIAALPTLFVLLSQHIVPQLQFQILQKQEKVFSRSATDQGLREKGFTQKKALREKGYFKSTLIPKENTSLVH